MVELFCADFRGVEQQEASAYLRAFGQHVKQLREARGLTQANVAFEAGLSVSQVQRIEYGQHNFTVLTLVALARALELPVGQLLEWKSSSPGKEEAEK